MSKFFKIIFVSFLIGLITGAFSSGFLHSLDWVTSLRKTHSYLIWGLPFFGLALGMFIQRMPHHVNQGVPNIIKQVESDEGQLSPWMAPFQFITSLGTHLYGGSAGREGVGVIMGASLAQILNSSKFKLDNLRQFLIYGGIAAGFSSIFGTPLAAIVFAFEIHSFKNIRRTYLILCVIAASYSALIVPKLLGPVHQSYEVIFSFQDVIPYLLIAGVAAGLGAQIFYWGVRSYTQLTSKLLPSLPIRLFIGALLISTLVYLTSGYPYIGIGTDIIARSFTQEMSWYDFAMKVLLTTMTLSIGFKGGEVTPLFFMGSTLSNWICSIFSFRNFGLSSSLGMVGLFGAATGTPFASILMSCELFGWKVGLCSVVSCLIARVLMGKRSVYRH